MLIFCFIKKVVHNKIYKTLGYILLRYMVGCCLFLMASAPHVIKYQQICAKKKGKKKSNPIKGILGKVFKRKRKKK